MRPSARRPRPPPSAPSAPWEPWAPSPARARTRSACAASLLRRLLLLGPRPRRPAPWPPAEEVGELDLLVHVHQSAIPRPIGTANAGLGSSPRSFLPTETPDERVADAHRDADELLELGREPGELRGAAREHELADAERVRLALVELERGDELAAEGLERRLRAPRAPERPARGRRPPEPCRPARPSSTLRRSASLGSISSARASASVRRVAAPFEDARELAAVAVGDAEDAALGADRDGDERAALGAAAGLGRERRRQRAQEREGLEVDAEQARCPPAGRPRRRRR